jgi:type II secretory pathway pseudopilin PulG
MDFTRNNRIRRRRGVSLLEMLVALGILIVLIGLLLPAVQGVRQAALKAKAANQLRQIAVGYQNYLSSDLGSHDSDKSNIGYGNLFQKLLPYLEQGNQSKDSTGMLVVSNYINPLDHSYTAIPPIDELLPGGNCSYVVNSLIRRSPVRGLSISDGTSSTIAFCEQYSRCSNIHTLWVDDVADCFEFQNGNFVRVACKLQGGTFRRATFSDELYSNSNRPILNQSTNSTQPMISGLTFQVRPNAETCDARIPQASTNSGLLISMADGSVNRLRPSIDVSLFWSLVTPAGGETIHDW